MENKTEAIVTLTSRIPESKMRELKKVLIDKDMTIQDFIVKAIEKELANA